MTVHIRTEGPDQHRAWRQRRTRDAWAGLGPVVYVIRRRGLVKIGQSSHLRRRLVELGAQPTDLLCVIPGDEALERSVHERFAHLRATGPDLGREHFRLEGSLLVFVNETRVALGMEPLD